MSLAGNENDVNNNDNENDVNNNDNANDFILTMKESKQRSVYWNECKTKSYNQNATN